MTLECKNEQIVMAKFGAPDLMKMELGVMELPGAARVPYSDPVDAGRSFSTRVEYEPVPPMDFTALARLRRLFQSKSDAVERAGA